MPGGGGPQRQVELRAWGLPGLQSELQDNQGYIEKTCLKNQTKPHLQAGLMYMTAGLSLPIRLPGFQGTPCKQLPAASHGNKARCLSHSNLPPDLSALTCLTVPCLQTAGTAAGDLYR